jgi:hypothetical protein
MQGFAIDRRPDALFLEVGGELVSHDRLIIAQDRKLIIDMAALRGFRQGDAGMPPSPDCKVRRPLSRGNEAGQLSSWASAGGR